MNISQYFETQTRLDGGSLYTLRDDRPDWLYDAVQEAHDGELPNDWRYETLLSIALMVDEGADDPYEMADNLATVYTSDLVSWMGDNLNRLTYVDEALEAGASNVSEAILQGQCMAIANMATILLYAVADFAE